MLPQTKPANEAPRLTHQNGQVILTPPDVDQTEVQVGYRVLGNILPRSLEIGFRPFIRGISASAPRIWYASLFTKPRCRHQPSRANSKISYKAGNWHASPAPTKRDYSDWAFIPCSGDDFVMTSLPPSKYSRAFWILIRTCFSFLPLDAT